MKRQYPALGIIATIYKICGILVLVGTIVSFALAIASYVISSSAVRLNTFPANSIIVIGGALLGLLSGGLVAIGLYGVGEIFDVMRDVELNTRAAAEDAHATARNTYNTARLLYQLVQNQQNQPAIDDTSTWKP